MRMTKATKKLVNMAIAPMRVEFVSRVVSEFAEQPTPVGTLRLLMPTECVMDRLAGFYHWNDDQCLEQAVMVALRHAIDLERVGDWSERESAAPRFERFLERLRAAEAGSRGPGPATARKRGSG